MCRAWDCNRWFLFVDPIVRRNVSHVLDGEFLWCAGARRLGHCLDDLSRVQALFDVNFRKGVMGRPSGPSSPSSPSARTVEVVTVCIVGPVATATST